MALTPPAIPPVVHTNDLITADHENSVSLAISDLWSNDQWLSSNSIPATRRVNAGTGLSGGGPMSADVTLSVVPDSTQQRIQFLANGSALGIRPALNLVGGTNVTLTSADDAANNRVNVTIAAAGGTGPGAVSTVFGRAGDVVAATGDYTAAQITNAVSIAGTYSNPAWITDLPWAKITGAPAFLVDPLSTLTLAGGRLGINCTPAASLDVNGGIRTIAFVVPASGVGVELLYDPTGTGVGWLAATDRDAGSARKDLNIFGGILTLNGSGYALVSGGVPGPYATDADAGTAGVLTGHIYYYADASGRKVLCTKA